MQANEDDDDPSSQRRFTYLAIEDEAEWMRKYGLAGEPHYGSESYANQWLAHQRIQAHRAYQERLHAKLFDEQNANNRERLEREKNLQDWKDQTVVLNTETETISYNLQRLASHADTVYTMAASRENFAPTTENSTIHDDSTSLVLNLTEYSHPAVQAFLELIDQQVEGKEVEPTPEHIVDSSRLAHFLQCVPLLEKTLVPRMIQSIDSANCLSLCQLADQLHLPTLLEASVNHMMISLASITDHDIWGDLTPELQDRIQTIQQILQSTQRRRLFFSSFEEYLALFAEQVDYYRERLEQAERQQEESKSKESMAWAYAQSKIEAQQKRVTTLRLMLQEQKKLFRNS